MGKSMGLQVGLCHGSCVADANYPCHCLVSWVSCGFHVGFMWVSWVSCGFHGVSCGFHVGFMWVSHR